MFGHISEAVNVATIFVNGISNIMSTACNDAKLSIKLNDPDCVFAIEKTQTGFMPCKKQGDTINIELGSVRFGQDLDIIIKLKDQFKVKPENFCNAVI